MSQPASTGSSKNGMSNGTAPDASNGSSAGQTSSGTTGGQSSGSATSGTQSGQVSDSAQNTQSESDEVRAGRLLRLVLAILRGGSPQSAASLIEAIRQNAREGSDEVDLRGVAESVLRICRDDPGVQEELEVVEALLREFREEGTIYTRFPM